MKKNSRSRPDLCWENRERDLAKVKRYHKFKVMFYRTDLLIHSKRVLKILESLLPEATRCYSELNSNFSLLISKFHDDYEMVSKRGDVPLQFKLLMAEKGDKNEILALKQEEIEAINIISKLYKNRSIRGYKYKDLLMRAVLKDCIEAQLHSFADKIDGYCEAIHEVLAGNLGFLEPVINYPTKTFSNLPKSFPLIERLFDNRERDNLFNFPVVDLKYYFEDGTKGAFLHTPESIFSKKTDISHYEFWKKITLTMPNGIDLLTKQKEFHKKTQT
ncbi:hypothetical protein KKB58_01610 [Patescibacteria group bacterium]|nr:hypothetical protein [Patescibacteria group bacterium]